MSKKNYFTDAIEWVQNKTNKSIRANYQGFEKPKSFINRSTQEEICPDITYTTSNGVKHYTEIALKKENARKLVTRWKLLSLLAAKKHGKLHLLAPRGHKMFTKRLINKYNINAAIYSL